MHSHDDCFCSCPENPSFDTICEPCREEYEKWLETQSEDECVIG